MSNEILDGSWKALLFPLLFPLLANRRHIPVSSPNISEGKQTVSDLHSDLHSESRLLRIFTL